MSAIFVTGGAKRVGAVLARHLADAGYDIALHYHESGGEAQALKKDIEAMGRKCALFQQDLSDVKTFPVLMESVKKTFPGCAALINNASVFERSPFMDTPEDLFDRQFAVNFKAPFFLTQAFAKIFGKGCVINFLDNKISGTHGSHFAYLLSKKTLAEFTVMAARDLAPNIRVNAICPGKILPSKSQQETLLPAELKLQAAQLQRVVQAAQRLCEDQALTGQLIFTEESKS